MPDGVIIRQWPRLADISTTEHTDSDGNTTTIYKATIELKRLGWLSLGLVAVGFVLGALIL